MANLRLFLNIQKLLLFFICKWRGGGALLQQCKLYKNTLAKIYNKESKFISFHHLQVEYLGEMVTNITYWFCEWVVLRKLVQCLSVVYMESVEQSSLNLQLPLYLLPEI